MFDAMRKVSAAVLVAAIASSASVASAMPGAALQSAAPTNVEQVRWGYGWGWGAGAGFVAGALIGGALAPHYYYPGPYYGPAYYGPAPVYAQPVDPGGDPVAYCMAHFKSYDPHSGTYLGYDGARHPCP
jgi:hypothetical protein